MKQHVWHKITHNLSFMFCTRCGLINLKNALMMKAIAKPCPGRDEDK